MAIILECLWKQVHTCFCWLVFRCSHTTQIDTFMKVNIPRRNVANAWQGLLSNFVKCQELETKHSNSWQVKETKQNTTTQSWNDTILSEYCWNFGILYVRLELIHFSFWDIINCCSDRFGKQKVLLLLNSMMNRCQKFPPCSLESIDHIWVEDQLYLTAKLFREMIRPCFV